MRFRSVALPPSSWLRYTGSICFLLPHQECVGQLMSCDHHVALVYTISPSLAFCTFHIGVDRTGMVQRQFEYRCLASTWIYATATTSLFDIHTHKHIRECDVLQCTDFDDDQQLLRSWAFHLCFHSHHTFTSETQICIVGVYYAPKNCCQALSGTFLSRENVFQCHTQCRKLGKDVTECVE